MLGVFAFVAENVYSPTQPMDIEVNLNIPTVKEPVKDASGYPISNRDIRFLKRLTVPSLPKPGDVLDLTAQPNCQFQATVVRSDWSDEKELFVVACRYLNRSIPRPEYLALMEDREWIKRPLLS